MAKKEKSIQHPEYEKAPMDRRTFIKRTAGVAGVATGLGYVAFAPEGAPGSRKDITGRLSEPEEKIFKLKPFTVAKPTETTPDIGIARGERIDGEFSVDHLRNLILKATDPIGGLKHYIKPGDTVLIKPNVAFDRSPNLGATSNPIIIEQLIRLVMEDCKASEVRVADNPIESAPDCFRKSGVGPAAGKAGARVYLPDDNAFQTLNTPGASLIEEWTFFARPFIGVDKVIGLSLVKDHNLCNASMGIKNWYGLLGGARSQFHQDIHGIISDLSMMIKPTMTIIDGTKVMMENGPTGGDPSNVVPGNVVLAGLDPVAVDTWCFEHSLKRGTDYPEYLYKSVEKGSGSMDWKGRTKEIVG
jgi:uncharacterized protein (DUF362 family)